MAYEMKDSSVPWIGDIPNDWVCNKLKYLFKIKKNIAGKEGYDILSVTQDGIKIKDISSNEGQIASDYSNYQLVSPGDYVMNHMDLLTGYIDISKYNGVTSPDYRVFNHINENIRNARFYLRIFQIAYKERIFYNLGQGVSNLGRWRLPTDQFYNFMVPIPPISEQDDIASFLDKESSLIDSITSDLETQIECLKQYKQSLITETVTKGLDKNVKMKDSGVEWIGKIPEHWMISKLKYEIHQFGSGTTPDSGNDKYYENGTYAWIQSGDLYQKDCIISTEKQITASAIRSSTALFCYKHDFLVIAMYGASVGNCAISKIDAYTNQACCVLIPSKMEDINYLYYYLTAIKKELINKAFGGTQPNISQIIIKNQLCLKLPLSEQKEIADFLDKQCSQIDAIMADKQTQLETLKKHKQSLIYEYVTGKKRVMGAA